MLLEVATRVAVVVALALPVAVALFVGRDRLRRTITEWRSRLRTAAPLGVVLLAVLVLNRTVRQSAMAFSTAYGFHMTSTFYAIEGEAILVLQSIASPVVTAYFSTVYVYGYAFLLVFPIVAYFALSDTEPFRRLLTAYSFNYAVGLVLYVLVIAYGPRNVMIEGFDTMLYDSRPEYRYLTREVNRNVNVFPSLHTSLAATVAIFAHATRDVYRAWYPVAVLLAGSVVISTMYLGLHWAIDVVAGLLLALASVAFARIVVGRWSIRELLDDRSSSSTDP